MDTTTETATITRIATTYIVGHGNSVTLHTELDEAMAVYNGGGCTGVEAECNEYTMDETGFILSVGITRVRLV
jgi:hypothetical protein